MKKSNKYDINNLENVLDLKQRNKVEIFHQKRTMFMILNNNVLYLSNSKLSHYQWAQSLNIPLEIFNSLTRGFVLNNKIIFYKSNFEFDQKVIDDAYKYAFKIIRDCNLDFADIFAGVKVGKIGDEWQPNKKLFTIH